MPRLLGVNVVGILLAGLAMFIVGALIYAVMFTHYMTIAFGYSVDDFGPNSAYWMMGGLVIELIIALGIGKMLKVGKISGLRESVKFTLMLGILIAVPISAYNFMYGPYHSFEGLLISSGHMIVNFAIAGAIFSRFE